MKIKTFCPAGLCALSLRHRGTTCGSRTRFRHRRPRDGTAHLSALCPAQQNVSPRPQKWPRFPQQQKSGAGIAGAEAPHSHRCVAQDGFPPRGAKFYPVKSKRRRPGVPHRYFITPWNSGRQARDHQTCTAADSIRVRLSDEGVLSQPGKDESRVGLLPARPGKSFPAAVNDVVAV